MRTLLVIVVALAAAVTVWSATGYFGAGAQQIETGAELRKSQSSGQAVTDTEIATHVSRIGQQGRNWGIAALMSAAIVVVSLMALAIASRPKLT